MATKADRFRTSAERQAQKRKPPKRSARAAMAARRERAKARLRAPNPATRNEAPAHARKSSYELELATTTRPSRKQTRKSSNRQKTDSGLRISAMNRVSSPKARAAAGRKG